MFMKLFVAMQSRSTHHKLLHPARDIFRSRLISLTMYDYYAADIIIRHMNAVPRSTINTNVGTEN